MQLSKKEMKIMCKKLNSLILAIIISTIFIPSAFSQFSFNDIKFDLIPYKAVKEYISNLAKDDSQKSLCDIHPSWKDSDTLDFKSQSKTFLIKDNLENVWNKYRNTSPAISWDGKKVMFGFMYSKKDDEPLYAGDDFDQIDTGQVIFLNLKLLKIYNLAMAFEIISVDEPNHTIEFSYIKGNAAEGKQSLQFVSRPDGYTDIVHKSYYKSKSKVRDTVLYPFFHTRTTNEFHRNMKKLIKDSETHSFAKN